MANRNGGRLSTTVLINKQIKCNTMKKEQIIKLMLFLIIPFLAISCDGNDLMESEETSLMQGDAQQGLLSDGASDNTCMVNLNLFTKPYFDYQYNTGDNVDECYVYIDGQKPFEYISLKGNENVGCNLPISFGKHRIKLNIEIDNGKSYTYPIELCNALVTLKNGEASTVLYDRIILKRGDSSVTNSAFTVEFDVYFPYTEKRDYTLDITLGFYDETYDDGSSGPYVNGNVSVNTYYQWRSIFEPAKPTDIDFVLGIVYNSTQKEYCYKGYCEQEFSIDRNGMAVNNVSWHKMVRLPNGDDIGYKLYLITGIWAKLQSNIDTMIGETEVSWYSAYYRVEWDDGEYSEWYPIDELDESSVGIDATIDYYPNIEIVCFNTKEIQDAYASQWGIVP